MGNRCQFADPCRQQPCRNGGVCHVVTRGDKVDFTCTCRLGFTDNLCLTPINHACLNSPCKNGGSCNLLSLTTYKCNCSPGWSGKDTATHSEQYYSTFISNWTSGLSVTGAQYHYQ